MAKFNIYSSDGTLKAVGYPTYTGTYMKPGVVEFREIASPFPIDWAVGDYVDYTKTGFRYKLYKLPQVSRKARNGSYGAAFVYQGVQFYDASYLLSLIPFRDLVPDDNRVHFSTQPSISVFANVSKIAERIQACLDVDYANEWNIQLATTAMGASQDVVDLMAEYRDFSVSGVTLQGVLEKIYEVWPEIGWTFSVVEGVNTITIGGAGLNLSSADSYIYGKSKGLLNLTRVVANSDELANRIYAYGSSRNMLSGWYRSKDIKDAASVDIEHLMIPISEWGETLVDGTLKPDAAKAYVEDSTSIGKLGLREKIVYFDGTGDLEEIYPTIQGMTIADVRDVVSSSDPYYPDATHYPDGTARVDLVKSVDSVFDSGLAADSGKQNILAEYNSLSHTSPFSLLANESFKKYDVFYKTITIPETGKIDYSITFEMEGSVAASDARVSAWLEITDENDDRIGKVDIDVTQSGSNWTWGNVTFAKSAMSLTTSGTLTATLWVQISANATSASARQYVNAITAQSSAYLSRFRSRTFKIVLRQLGFDISEQATLGNGKTIHFRTGKCAGRTFTINSCTFQSSSNTWLLEVIRSEDESLSQWFPNSDYPVRGAESGYEGDQFVLLDIAMPDSYVEIAENRLLAAAQDYLSWTKKEIWQYTPEIDAKFMVENNRSINPAEYMILIDTDIVDSSDLSGLSFFKEHNNVYYLTSLGQKILLDGSGYSDAVLVDSVSINEGDSTIPTYKVTLRERKRKKVTSSVEVQGTTSNPVKETPTTTTSYKRDTFFQEDENGYVWLKDEYLGICANGIGSFGGLNPNGGGGGGGLNVKEVGDFALPNPFSEHSETDTFNAYAINDLHRRISALESGSGGDYLPLTGGTLTGSLTMANNIAIKGAYGSGSFDMMVLNSSGQLAVGSTSAASLYRGSALILQTAASAGTPVNRVYVNMYGGVTIGASDLAGNAVGLYVNGNTTINGDLSLTGSFVFGNNVPLKWKNTSGTATAILNYNASNQVVLGAGLTMDTSGNITLSGDTTIAHGKAINFKNSSGTARNGISMSSNSLYVGSAYQPTYIYGKSSSGNAIAMYYGSSATLGLGINYSTGRTVAYKGISMNGTNSDNTEAYIDFDTTTGVKAFHIHGNLYVDGYVSAGGLNNEDEVITGTRTFNNRALVLTNDATASSPKYVNLVVDSSNVLHFYNSKTTTTTWASIKCQTCTQASDARLKDNIAPLSVDYAVDKLMQLRPSTWTWNKDCCYAGKPYAGFVAQEVKGVIPQMVDDGDKYMSMDYSMLHAFEVSTIQMLVNEVKELRRRLGYE